MDGPDDPDLPGGAALERSRSMLRTRRPPTAITVGPGPVPNMSVDDVSLDPKDVSIADPDCSEQLRDKSGITVPDTAPAKQPAESSVSQDRAQEPATGLPESAPEEVAPDGGEGQTTLPYESVVEQAEQSTIDYDPNCPAAPAAEALHQPILPTISDNPPEKRVRFERSPGEDEPEEPDPKKSKEHFATFYNELGLARARRSCAATSFAEEAALAELISDNQYYQAEQSDIDHEIYAMTVMQRNLDAMQDKITPWTRSEAHWVIPGPWHSETCFYFDMRTGEALTYAVGGDMVLTAQDLEEHWELVCEADRAEILQFVEFNVFELAAKQNAGTNIVDATWVRRWKWCTTTKRWIIKSRLCGRGFLDKQRYDVQKHSATASRLSQRLLCSPAVQHNLVLESWDISSAFLQGLNFKDLYKQAQKFKLEIRDARQVYLKPPANVWKHLREIKGSKINVQEADIGYFLLLLLKAMYGLVDAPLLWSIVILTFIMEVLGGTQSYLDDNFFYWVQGHQLVAVATIHVDDIAVAACLDWLLWALARLEERFGKVKRQQLPFVHMGMKYELVGPLQTLRIIQATHLLAIKPLVFAKDIKDDAPVGAALQSAFRGLLTSMLYDTQTRIELMCEVTLLQQFNNDTKGIHLKAANKLLKKAQTHAEDLGVYFPRLTLPLRLASVGDASHASGKTSYAQEGKMCLLMSDSHEVVVGEGDIVAKTSVPHMGGRCHILLGTSRKSKRVSQSTSHGETVCAVTCSQDAQLVALRFTEIFGAAICGEAKLSLRSFMRLEAEGKYVLPIDHYTDCHDLWELVCGIKGVPSDKTQRLSILFLRESRLTGRIRRFIFVPTEFMIADALTKLGIFKEMLRLLSSGVWEIENHPTKPMQCRQILEPLVDYSEKDLLNIHFVEMSLGSTTGGDSRNLFVGTMFPNDVHGSQAVFGKYDPIKRDRNSPFAHAARVTAFLGAGSAEMSEREARPDLFDRSHLPPPGSADWHPIIRRIYAECIPRQVKNLDALIAKYTNMEMDWYVALCARYSPNTQTNFGMDWYCCRICGGSGHWGNECPLAVRTRPWRKSIDMHLATGKIYPEEPVPPWHKRESKSALKRAAEHSPAPPWAKKQRTADYPPWSCADAPWNQKSEG